MYDLEELKEQVYNTDFNDDTINVINWLISEVERLRTVEQAYQALLSATAGQQK